MKNCQFTFYNKKERNYDRLEKPIPNVTQPSIQNFCQSVWYKQINFNCFSNYLTHECNQPYFFLHSVPSEKHRVAYQKLTRNVSTWLIIWEPNMLIQKQTYSLLPNITIRVLFIWKTQCTLNIFIKINEAFWLSI